MRGHRLRYGIALVCMGLSALFLFLTPLVIRATIDHTIAGRPIEGPSIVGDVIEWLGGTTVLARNLWMAGLAVGGLMALSGLFLYLKGHLTAEASQKIVRALRDRLYDQIQHLPASYFDRAETGDLVQRCTSDVETFRNFMNEQVIEIGRVIIMVSLAVGIMVSLDGRMTLVATALLPVIFAVSYFFFLKVKAAFKKVDEAEGAMTTVLQENLTGIRVVRAFGRQGYEIEKFGGRNERYRELRLNLLAKLAIFWSFSDLLCLMQLGLVLILGGFWASTGALTIGTLYAFFQYVLHYMWPVRQLGRVLSDLGQAVVALGRMQDILHVERETEPRPVPGLPARVSGNLEFENLSFAFNGSGAVVNDISFKVQAGETVALLGPSGSGKSTIIQLLLRLYDYKEGSIRLDGNELNTLDRKYVRSQMGVVLQEPFLYSRSIKENIKLGRAGASDREMTDVAAIACIHDTIQTFEGQYDTVIGERGVTLSGGQRQRVAIARALLKDPPFLILDDALSAVDTETETVILDALRKRHHRQTTLVVAHRLSTLKEADRIIVLDKGRIVQSGSPEELLKQDGMYKRLWNIQNALEEDLKS